jgi:hypothetical protein
MSATTATKAPAWLRMAEPAFWLLYAALPVALGLWFRESFDCVYPWRALGKEVFSAIGYFALPLARAYFGNTKHRPFVLGSLLAITAMAILGAGGNVIDRC